MMLKVLSVVCILALCHSLPPPKEEKPEEIDLIDVDEVLRDIFGPQSTTKPAEAASHDKRSSETKDEVKCEYNGTHGVCVPYYLCSRAPETSDTIDIHFHIDESCVSYLDVCCDKKYITEDPRLTEKKSTKSEAH